MCHFQRMLKDSNSMKETDVCAGEAPRGLLERIPILQVQGIDAEAGSSDWEPDLIARLLVDGRPHELICEYKSNVPPRQGFTLRRLGRLMGVDLLRVCASWRGKMPATQIPQPARASLEAVPAHWTRGRPRNSKQPQRPRGRSIAALGPARTRC